jgi:hypothetical protein
MDKEHTKPLAADRHEAALHVQNAVVVLNPAGIKAPQIITRVDESNAHSMSKHRTHVRTLTAEHKIPFRPLL